jgi:ribosome-interacting GTPase 1
MEELNILDKFPHYVPVSAFKSWNLDELHETIWEYLSFIRVYTKPKVSQQGPNSRLRAACHPLQTSQ